MVGRGARWSMRLYWRYGGTPGTVQKQFGGEQSRARDNQGTFNANTACSAEAEAYNSGIDIDAIASHEENQ